MDISNWSLDRIMQLPDHMFGRRWLVSITCYGHDQITDWGTTLASMPERFVIWDMHLQRAFKSVDSLYWTFRLGDVVPANAAEFNAMELLFPDITGTLFGRSSFTVDYTECPHFHSLRMPIQGSGRKIVGECFFNAVSPDEHLQAIFTISSIPRTIEWPNSV